MFFVIFYNLFASTAPLIKDDYTEDTSSRKIPLDTTLEDALKKLRKQVFSLKRWAAFSNIAKSNFSNHATS